MQMESREGRQSGGRGGDGQHAAFSNDRQQWQHGLKAMQQLPKRGAGKEAAEHLRRRVDRATQAQREQQRPASKARKGSSGHAGPRKGDATAGYGTKNERKEAKGGREKDGRHYQRGEAAGRGRDSWGRGSGLERTCGPPEGAFGNGSARGDGSENVGWATKKKSSWRMRGQRCGR